MMSPHHGKTLQSLLRERKISIVMFANYMNVSRQSIHSMINKSVLNKSDILLIITLLGVEPQVFNYKVSDFQTNFTKPGFASKVKLEELSFPSISFKNSDFSGANFVNSDFENADFEEANLKSAKFINCNLKHLNLSYANLDETDFTRSDLTGANLKGIKNWENCVVFKANVESVINKPEGFTKWALIGQAATDRQNWEERKDIDDIEL